MSHFIHENAICESDHIGEGTRIWAFCHILPRAVLGSDVNVCEHVFIENDVVVGDRCTIKSGVQLWDGVRLGDDVFIGPNATFTNDHFPRSKQYPHRFAKTVVEDRASVGGGAVLLPGVTVGTGAMIGAGAVVTRDVPANAIVVGNPARIVGYSDANLSGEADTNELIFPWSSTIVRTATDLRGSLAAIEFGDLPFPPVRFFMVHGVPSKDVRGQHAHRRCEQYLVCLAGSVTCLVDDGTHRSTTRLSPGADGVYMPALTWGAQYHYTADAVLGVFASQPYDPSDYIRDYQLFLAALRDRSDVAR